MVRGAAPLEAREAGGQLALGAPRRCSARRSAAALLLCAVASLSCDQLASVTPSAGSVIRIEILPASANLNVGFTLTLVATAYDDAGNAQRERTFFWTSEDPSIATVSPGGVVTAIAPGTVRIAASSGGSSATATITVLQRPVNLVRVLPIHSTIMVNGSVTLRAEALDAAGNVLAGRSVSWSSSQGSVAAVTSGGIVTGLAPGAVIITATVEGRSGAATVTVAMDPVASVTVTPALDTIVVGGRVRLQASATDAQNRPVSNRPVIWSSDDPTVAPVSAEGDVVGLAPGSANITATVEGKSATARVVVRPVPVARVSVTPNALTLLPGQTAQLTVTLTDASGNELTGRAVTFTSTAPQIATVSASGLVTAVAEGSAEVRVTSEGRSAVVALTVRPPPIASIRVSPDVIALRVGQTFRLVAQGFDAQGNPLAGRSFTWSSSAPAVVSVDQSGSVTAVASGTATITASAEGHSASAAVSVTPVQVAAISISPAAATLTAGQQRTFSVQLRDSTGNTLSTAGRTVNWASRNSAVATVSSSGVVTAVGVGSTHIVVSTPGASAAVLDSAVVTVTPLPVVNLVVQPGAQTLAVGQSAALRAVLSDASGVVRGRAVSWQSRTPGVATVSAVAGWPDSAVVVAVAPGSAYVVASEAGGRSDSAQIVVQAPPVASVVLSPATLTLNANTTSQLTAVVTDAAGNHVSVPLTWSSLSPSIATVSSSGLVTAKASGSAVVEARAVGAGVGGKDVVGTATVTVPTIVQAVVQSITLSAPRSFIVPGDTMHLTVVLRDAQGNVLTGQNVTFSSSAASRVAVNSAGVLTGVGTSGSADITATSGGRSAKVTIDSDPPVGAIGVSGPDGDARDLLIKRGETKRYTVTVTDPAGKPVRNQVIAVSASSGAVTLSKSSLTTNSSGQATLDIKAGKSAGLAVVTFEADRAGAVPPALPGSNTVTVRLPIVVP